MSSATILIIDDLSDIRMIIKRTLVAAGYQVVEAANGHEGIHVARKCKPDLIVTDLSLPGFDGWEVVARLRSDPTFEDVPIIVMTGYGLASTAQAALRAGCQQVIFKPFKMQELERQVTRLIEMSDSPARAVAGVPMAYARVDSTPCDTTSIPLRLLPQPYRFRSS